MKRLFIPLLFGSLIANASRPGFVCYGTSCDYAVIGDEGTTHCSDSTGRPFIWQGENKVFFTKSNETFVTEDGSETLRIGDVVYTPTYCSDTLKPRPVTKSTTYAIIPTRKP